ncbi:MAG: AAA family ATPase [Methylovulum sp.]|nr:AAA family ATPase [Methylovulum sp.]MCF7998522.1 AAA family ATPase [Methylovulum sp.]
MLLEKLKLVNFRQFYNETEIEFSTDPQKNITLIHGENGVGKTTILNSILWCLYEKLTHDFEQQKELICIQAIKDGVKSCRVELSFQYEEKHYLAQRSLHNSNQSLLKLFEINNSNYKDVPNPTAFVNNILPSDMAEYFFFHGEGVSNINATKSGEKFRRAIRDILGFRLAETAIKDLKEINAVWTKALNELTNLNYEQNELVKKKSIYEGKKIGLLEKLRTFKEEKEDHETNLNEVLEKLRQCSSVDARKLQKEIDDLVAKNSKLDTSINRARMDRQNLIKKYGWIIFGQKLANEALDFIDEQSLKAKLPAPYDASLVNDLIEQQKCICGRELKRGTREFENVTNLIDKADNAVIRSKLSKARSAGSNIKSRFSDFLVELQKVEENLQELDNDKRDVVIALETKQAELKDIPVEEVQKLESRKKLCNEARSKAEQNIGANKRSIEQCDKDLIDIDLKLKRCGAQDTRINKLTQYQDYASNLIKLCEKKLNQYEKDSKLIIAQNVNKTLQDFSRKDFYVKVDEDFGFHLIRENGQKVAKSKGENLLLNLSFVSALIEFAQMRSSASGDFLVSGTTAPFVIDAPFGELDNTYKKASAEFLPKRSRQLIFLLSSSHWEGTVDEAIRDKIGSEYILISSKNSIQGEKPSDKLTINGIEFIQSLYSQEKEATFIKRVK